MAFLLLWYPLIALCVARLSATGTASNYTVDIRMDHVVAEKPDELLCKGIKLDAAEAYILKLTPHASKSTAHHMNLFGCGLPANLDLEKPWKCPGDDDPGDPESVCQDDDRKILFNWALDAPELSLPDGVGMRVGGETGINYLVIQLHYAKMFEDGLTDSSGYTLHMTRQRPEQQAGYIILGNVGYIPPRQPQFHMESYCVYNRSYPVYPIRYRTHSHNLGVVTSGYRVRHRHWTEIGRMSPQLPQTYYPVSQPGMEIHKGDKLFSRCTMNSMERRQRTYMGARNWDEMCNFYIMFTTRHMGTLENQYCFLDAQDFQWRMVVDEIPADASSLRGIPGADKVREKFHLKPK